MVEGVGRLEGPILLLAPHDHVLSPIRLETATKARQAHIARAMHALPEEAFRILLPRAEASFSAPGAHGHGMP